LISRLLLQIDHSFDSSVDISGASTTMVGQMLDIHG
jgi:hypothetical protein